MAGFIWKSEMHPLEEKKWMLRLSTIRKQYFEGAWDEEVSAIYLSGDRAGQSCETFREMLDGQRELVLFIARLQEGDILQIKKCGELDSFRVIIQGEHYWLAADFLEVVQDYVRERRSASWLLEQLHRSTEQAEA